MKKKIIFSILVGVLIIGITQISLSEESKDSSRINVDVDSEEFKQPESKYALHQIRVVGHIDDYSRGENVNIVMIKPNGAEEEFNIFASKKGNFQTFIQITHNSQIGTHELILKYQGEEIAFTLFNILEN